MNESTKDDIEFVTAQTAAGVLEIFPGGSLLSKAILVPLELAERRRTARILTAIQADIERLQAAGKLTPSFEDLASSDRFMANLTEAMRAAKATSDKAKRKLLRNAVLNSEMNPQGEYIDEFFMRLVGRYAVHHIWLLRFAEPFPAYVSDEASYPVVDGKPSGVMRDLLALAQAAFPEQADLVIPIFQELRNDGMLLQSQPPTYGLQDTGDPSRPDSISPLGRSFLAFVQDPMEHL